MNAEEFATKCDDAGRPILHWRGDFHEYNGGTWPLLGEHTLGKKIIDAAAVNGESLEAREIGDVTRWLSYDRSVPDDLTPPAWLPDAGDPDDRGRAASDLLVVRNGLLDLTPVLEGGEPVLRPHTPRLFALASAEYSYDPDAQCPRFRKWLKWFTSGREDVERLLLEWLAYCLFSSRQFQRFMLLFGPGSNGKGVFTHVATHLLGEGNVSAVKLDRLGGRFDAAETIGKLGNFVADLDEITKVSEGNLKMLCDGSKFSTERKFRAQRFQVITARFMYGCNVMPRFRDRSDGIWRRALIVPCEAKFEKRIEKLEERFVEDLPGILNLVIEAGKRLTGKADFDVPAICQATVDEVRLESNSAAAFLKDRLYTCEGGEVLVGELYQQYKGFCERAGYSALNLSNFGSEVRRMFPGTTRVKGNWKGDKRPYKYVGVKYGDPTARKSGPAPATAAVATTPTTSTATTSDPGSVPATASNTAPGRRVEPIDSACKPRTCDCRELSCPAHQEAHCDRQARWFLHEDLNDAVGTTLCNKCLVHIEPSAESLVSAAAVKPSKTRSGTKSNEKVVAGRIPPARGTNGMMTATAMEQTTTAVPTAAPASTSKATTTEQMATAMEQVALEPSLSPAIMAEEGAIARYFDGPPAGVSDEEWYEEYMRGLLKEGKVEQQAVGNSSGTTTVPEGDSVGPSGS